MTKIKFVIILYDKVESLFQRLNLFYIFGKIQFIIYFADAALQFWGTSRAFTIIYRISLKDMEVKILNQLLIFKSLDLHLEGAILSRSSSPKSW